MKYVRMILRIIFLTLVFWLPQMETEAGTIFDSPYVDITGDGAAWTTCAGELHNYHYQNGYTVKTGVVSSKRSLQTGEHYYNYSRKGLVPIGRWVVAHDEASCIHDDYKTGDYHGIDYGKQFCERKYTQGWFAYCADCDEKIAHVYIYMCEDAAKSIGYLPLGMDYYYLCPHCANLEQGYPIKVHICEKVSWNQYKVIYDANTEMPYSGVMQPSYHMYNNATEYEGKKVSPNTHLSTLSYSRVGYEFIGWNTKADGSGTWYEDEAEILNLTADNYEWDGMPGCVYLYAQWRLSESILEIDPAGGYYMGKSDITTIRQQYQTGYHIQEGALIAPKGPTLSFSTNGGTAVTSIVATCYFEEWTQEVPFAGWLSDDIYYFQATSGNVDRITAKYAINKIKLPGTKKENVSFGGWYFDAEFKCPAGNEGDFISITEDTTLYAQWVELELFSKENYVADNGCGAVDLWWAQADNGSKAYKLYRYEALNSNELPGVNVSEWTQLSEKADAGNMLEVSKKYTYAGTSNTYTIPYTGLYTLTAAGAQGGNANSGVFQGGLGGEVCGTFWFSAGDKLTIEIGGQNGYNNGGKGSDYGNGGGCTVITSAEKGVVLVAGGGGGATIKGDGGAGGSSTSLRNDGQSAGESGGSGGGAGYIGGTAGELIVHKHSEACYYSESTAYTLFGGGTWSGWMNHYWNDGEMYNVFVGGRWGDSVLREENGISLQCHSAEWDEEQYFGHLMALGTYDNKQKPAWAGTYIPTNGNTVAEIDLLVEDWGNSTYLDFNNSYIKVYNQDDSCIYERALIPQIIQKYDVQTDDDTLYYVPEQPEINNNGIAGLYRDYKQSYTWIDDDGDWQGEPLRDVLSGTISVSLPAGTSEIYIEVFTRVNMGNNAYTDHKTTIAGVRFVGGVNSTIICGYKEGQVISSKPGYGGSNYVNTDICAQYTEKAGVQKGDGYFAIQSTDIGYLEEMSMNAVSARDRAAPEPIGKSTILLKPVVEGAGKEFYVQWEEPRDNGTDYYFMVESHVARTGAKISRSNITHHVMTSGISGYRYIVDSDLETVVKAGNGIYIEDRALRLALKTETQYLHIAAVDVAGNISATTTINLGSISNPAEIRWPIYTEQIAVTDGEGIAFGETENTFYVRCDGSTPIELSFGTYMEGAATKEYQITHTIFETVSPSGVRAWNVIETPTVDVQAGDIIFEGSKLRTGTDGISELELYLNTRTVRSDYNKELEVSSQFVIGQGATGQSICVTPIAAVKTSSGFVYSNAAADAANSIYLIGDCEAPIICGTDVLEQNRVIDRGAGKVYLQLSAEDELSGLKEFWAYVFNEDNAGSRTYTADENGNIVLDITGDSPLFAGDFTVTLNAVDRVGNQVTQVYHITEYGMETKVERILAPHTPIFKRGESGILSIDVWGHIEKVEVKFPHVLSQYDETYLYEDSPYQTTEKIQFMIPLEIEEDGEYEIEIRAYKSNEQLTDTQVITIQGTVLDDLRTRVR